MTLTSAQLSDISSIAVDNVQKEIPDTMAKANFLWSFLVKNKKYLDGGDTVRFPIAFKELDSQGFVNGTTDVNSLNPQQTFTHGNLNWKYYTHAVVVTLDDLTRASSSKEAIVDIMVGKVNQAKSSVSRALSLAAHTSGTAGNKAFNGLPDIFAASGTSYAGLLNTDFDVADQWLPIIDSGTSIINYDNIALMIDNLRERCQGLYNQTTGEGYDVDVAFSRAGVRHRFVSSEQNKARYVDQKKLEAGFDVVSINGVDWAIDANTPGSVNPTTKTSDNYLYILSSKSMMLFYKYGFENPSPLDQKGTVLPNQSQMFNVSYLTGNIACNNRRVNGVFKTLIA